LQFLSISTKLKKLSLLALKLQRKGFQIGFT